MARLGRDPLPVANDGPEVAPERLDRLKRPSERGPTRTEGSGLELAIVAAICRGGGLKLELAKPRPGASGGFCAAVGFVPQGRP